MPFKDYAGTSFVPYLLPIIPATATLSPTRDTKLTPDKLGKIPGRRHSDGWSGFYKWQEQVTTESLLSGYASMYAKEGVPEIIGIQARKFPGLDIDLSSRPIVEAIRDIAFEAMGETISRGRANSARVLLMYRAAEGEPMRKVRHVYQNALGVQEAIEFLAHGQQYLIEGMHSSGVPYSWGMLGPIEYEDDLPVVGPDQVEAFFERADAAMALVGWTRVKGSSSMSSTLEGELHEIGPDHPERCPDMDWLTDVLQNWIKVTDPEFADYDDWENGLRAIATACCKDEQFYDEVLVPWNSVNPLNEVETLRAKWDSYRETSLGWSYLAGIAHNHNYTSDVQEMMPALEDDLGKPIQPAGPTGPPRNEPTEQFLAEQFVKAYARKELIHVPAKAGGQWMRCEGGIWVPDFTAGEDAAAICGIASRFILSQPNPTQTERARATSIMSAHTQNAVLNIAKTRRVCSVKSELLDAHLSIMGVPGGYIDEKGKLRDPDPGLLLTLKTGVRPDFDALCPMFDNLVRSLANFDKDVEDCLWRLIGYTACGVGDQQMFPFLHGKGNEGKTTFFTILGKVFGDYAKTFKPEIFMLGQDNRFATSAFAGAWLIYGSEIAKGAKWNDAAIKMVTGGGDTPVEKKFIDLYQVPIRFMPWFSGNNLPHFSGSDTALRRRMALFHCMTPLVEVVSSWDRKVFDAEGPAILAKAIRYRQAYFNRARPGNLVLAPQVQKWTDDHFAQNDTTGQFIEECLIADKAAPPVLKQDVYDRYQEYARGSQGQEFIRGRNRFYDEFDEHPKLLAMGGKCVRFRIEGPNTDAKACVRGVRLKSAFEILKAG